MDRDARAGDTGRFAPSTTGEAHPGTLLSALLVWLDARARDGRVILRFEDLDRDRCKPAWADQLRDALAWLGLDWDEIVIQSDRAGAHATALDQLAALGRLYPCTCSRGDRVGARRAPDGGWAYPNTCRDRPLPPGGWRAVTDSLRCRLDDDAIALVDEGGLDLGQTPAIEMGDPIVRRKDGAIAYHLACVVDDADEGVTRIVRGRDIAPSTATQIALQRLLGVPTPRYRHHLLLLEPRPAGPVEKLAKLHGAIPFSLVRPRHPPAELCGLLAHGAGLLPSPQPCVPRDLIERFAWERVPTVDRVARWDSYAGLVIDGA